MNNVQNVIDEQDRANEIINTKAQKSQTDTIQNRVFNERGKLFIIK